MYTAKLRQQIAQQLQNRQYEVHPLEAQPLTHFFSAVWEGTGHWCLTHRVSREQDGVSARRREIPDTVVWENNIPKGWYRYEDELERVPATEDGEPASRVVKGNVKREKVDTQKIDAAFTAGKADSDVVCTYLSRSVQDGEEWTRVAYLTKTELRNFLFARNKGKGSCIVQQWVTPQNGLYNDVVQAVWTAGLPCLIERRRVCKSHTHTHPYPFVFLFSPLSLVAIATTRVLATMRLIQPSLPFCVWMYPSFNLRASDKADSALQ